MALIRCPVCQQPFDSDKTEAMPFCSARCKQIDLKRWLGEEYGVPATDRDEEFDEPPLDEDPPSSRR
jgi:endogenous inhibitor of DNA gyrase (YacG/DUF329 family)